MGTPVDKDFVRRFILQQRIESGRREVALRTQHDYRVFISYSRADHVAATRVAALLDGRNIRYFLDEKELGWGDPIGDKILEHLGGATHFLLILSRSSVSAPWPAFEFGAASALRKQRLIILIDDVPPPPFAASILATRDWVEVERYFSRELIDPGAIDRFIEEILDERGVDLGSFRDAGVADEGRHAWDAPNRAQLEQERQDPLAAHLDGYIDTTVERLTRIELGDAQSERPLVLHYERRRARPARYVFSYQAGITALVVEPKKARSDPVAVWEATGDGGRRLRPGLPSVADQLNRRDVYGWQASSDFVQHALGRLREQLPGGRVD